MLPDPHTALQHGDTVHLLLVRTEINEVERAIAAGPEGAA
jgi:hypothetical protein